MAGNQQQQQHSCSSSVVKESACSSCDDAETKPLIVPTNNNDTINYSSVNNGVKTTCLHGHAHSFGGESNQNEGPLTFGQMHHLVHDIHEYGLLKERLLWFTVYMFLLVLFIGLNLALLYSNTNDVEYIEANYEVPFHLFSFWGVFVFTLVEAALLISTNGRGRSMTSSSSGIGAAVQLSTMTIFASVMASFLAAVLYTLDHETFEVPAHWVEYVVQLLLSGINVWLVASYCYFGHPQQQQDNVLHRSTSMDTIKQSSSWVYELRHMEMSVAIAVVVATIWMMLLYAEICPTKIGGERAAHFVEFATDVVNGIFALVYAMLSYNDLHSRLSEHIISAANLV